MRRLLDWERDGRLLKLFRDFAGAMSRAEALGWKEKLRRSLDRRMILWKADLLVCLEIRWPARR